MIRYSDPWDCPCDQWRLLTVATTSTKFSKMFPTCDQTDLLRPVPTAVATIATILRPPWDSWDHQGDLVLSLIHFKKNNELFSTRRKKSRKEHFFPTTSLNLFANIHATYGIAMFACDYFHRSTPAALLQLFKKSWSQLVSSTCNRSVRLAYKGLWPILYKALLVICVFIPVCDICTFIMCLLLINFVKSLIWWW